VQVYRHFDNLNELSETSARIEAPGGLQGIQHMPNRRDLAQQYSRAVQEMLSASAKVREGLVSGASPATSAYLAP
jgi:hypothetical protein